MQNRLRQTCPPICFWLTLSVFLSTPVGLFAQQKYVLTDLQAPAGLTSSAANGINESGEIVGNAYVTALSKTWAFLWKDDSMHLIAPPAGYLNSTAYEISDAGAIGGTVTGGATRPFLYISDYFVLAPFPGSTSGAQGFGVNSSNAVVGWGWKQADTIAHAAVWQGGTIFDLGTLPDVAFSSAVDINDAGQVIGTSDVDRASPQHTRAVLYDAGAVTDLGVLPGYLNSSGQGINDQGWAVGYVQSPGTGEAFLWKPGAGMTGLGKLAGGSFSQARAVNDSGVVVGSSATSGTQNPHGIVWRNNVATDLNQVTAKPPGWVITGALDINNTGQIAGTGTIGGVTKAILLDPILLELAGPDSGALVLADHPYEIRWHSLGVDSISLEYSLDSGETFQTITDPVVASDERVSWIIPDTFSVKCLLRITDVADTTIRDTSALFRIKGYVLTRYKPNGDYEAFRPELHGWRFGNTEDNMWPQEWWQQFDYENGIDFHTQRAYPPLFSEHPMRAKPENFIDWPLFVRTFDPSNCYWGARLTYNFFALDFWRAVKEDHWGGSCLGFAVSSLLAFKVPELFTLMFPEVGSFENLHDLPVNDDRRLVINQLFLSQMGASQVEWAMGQYGKDPRATLQDVKEMFLNDQYYESVIAINHPDGSGGHAVVPYKLQRDGDAGKYKLFVYDNNCPGGPCDSIGIFHLPWIGIDSSANSWNYDILGWEDSGKGCYLYNHVGLYLDRAGLWSMAEIEILTSGGGPVSISDSAGNTAGFQDSVTFNHLPGAFPIVPPTSRYHPPIGYAIPRAGYAVQLMKFPDSLASASVFRDSAAFDYWRSDATPAQTDRIVFGEGIAVGNPDAGIKKVNVGRIQRLGSGERVFQILDCPTVQNDSIQAAFPDADRMKFVNFGPMKTFDLRIAAAGAGGTAEFLREGLELPANASQLIVPDWLDLSYQSVRMYTDMGNNGTIDDSLTIANQVTNLVVRGLWNIISVPRTVADARKSAVFPSAVSNAFAHGATGYAARETLQNSAGYWLKFPSAQTLPVIGDEIAVDTIAVSAGWNMIGSITRPVDVNEIASIPPGIMTSQFFGFGVAYYASDSIMPGKGYWVKVIQGGQLILASAGAPSPFNRIRIVPTDEFPPSPPGNGGQATPATPTEYALMQNHPNPFNPVTVITYQIPAMGTDAVHHVQLAVYNALGEKVATLVNELQAPGVRSVQWDASDFPSGVYFYRLQAGAYMETRKLILLR